jgi:hypothetical protein
MLLSGCHVLVSPQEHTKASGLRMARLHDVSTRGCSMRKFDDHFGIISRTRAGGRSLEERLPISCFGVRSRTDGGPRRTRVEATQGHAHSLPSPKNRGRSSERVASQGREAATPSCQQLANGLTCQTLRAESPYGSMAPAKKEILSPGRSGPRVLVLRAA